MKAEIIYCTLFAFIVFEIRKLERAEDEKSEKGGGGGIMIIIIMIIIIIVIIVIITNVSIGTKHEVRYTKT